MGPLDGDVSLYLITLHCSLVVISCILAPYMLAFQEGFDVNNLFFLDTVLNILFFIDIIVNFNTAILMEDLEIIDERRVS